jgi:UDP-glucuronate 4-epimerase
MVTGAAGFIGSHVCERLLAAGREVRGVDNLNDYYSPESKLANLRLLRNDPRFDFQIADFRDLDRELEGCDEIVHLAARAGVRRSFEEPDEYRATNVEGTAHLLDAAHARGVRRIVFASSSSVYGEAPVPTSETAPLVPISPYAESKLEAEEICTRAGARDGTAVAILRLFTVYGPRQRPDQAIRKFMTALGAGAALELYGDGSSARDYTFVGDVTEAVLLALQTISPDQPAIIANVGTGVGTRLSDLVKLLAATAGRALEVRRGEP